MDSKVVEMPFDQFMSKFMPAINMPAGFTDTIPKISSDVLLGQENAICEELCKVAQAIFDKCDFATEKLVAKNTSHNPDPADSDDFASGLRADVCFYPADGRAAVDYSLPVPVEAQYQTYQGRTCWAWLSLLIEVKKDLNLCAFGFTEKPKPKKEAQSETVASTTAQEVPQSTAEQPTKGVVTAAKRKKGATSTSERRKRAPKPMSFVRSGSQAGAQESLGQIAEYVSRALRRQHRLHLFTMLVSHGQARVMRWDRAGAIVSEPIDFEKDPSLLHRVIWNYACMDRLARGHDLTVSLASADDIEKMRGCKYWSPDNWVEKRRDNALGQPGWPVCKIAMRRDSRVNEKELGPIDPDVPHEKAREVDPACADDFIIGKHYFATGSPTGRGTRCYIAYDVAYDRLVFFKDFWCSYIDDEASPSEGSILTQLRTKNVTNVPTPLAHEDVQSPRAGGQTVTSLQATLTQEFLGMDQKTGCRPPAQRHYRLVIKEICRPLEDHEDAYELVDVLFDVVDAHEQAYVKGFIHRDLSSGNVLLFSFIGADGLVHTIGILNDWDLAKSLNYLNKITRPGRSGTWQFMSSRLLRIPGKKHELADDLESIIYILRWESLRFYKTSFGTVQGLRDHIITTYERYSIHNGRELGGDAKPSLIEAGSSGFKLKYPENPLSRLLETLAKICQEHYLAVENAPDFPATMPSQKIRTITQSKLDKRNKAKSRGVNNEAPKPSSKPVSTPTEKLSKHDAVLEAFAAALDAPPEKWAVIKKMEDQFALFKDSPEYQRCVQNTSELSAGSKRSRAQDEQTGRRCGEPLGGCCLVPTH